MSTVQAAVSDMLVTVKSREVQRGTLAEMRGNRSEAARHLLAAAHMELVLAGDYAQVGQGEMAWRSRVSAASCFWRAGQEREARCMFDGMLEEHPERASEIQGLVKELETRLPGPPT